MQIYGDHTSAEWSTERWSCIGSDRRHLGRVDGHSVSESRPRRRLYVALRRRVDASCLLHRLAARTSRLHVRYPFLLSRVIKRHGRNSENGFRRISRKQQQPCSKRQSRNVAVVLLRMLWCSPLQFMFHFRYFQIKICFVETGAL